MNPSVQVTWTGPGLRMEGRAGDSSIVLDHILPGEERREEGARPLDLLLVGLAGCTGMDVVSILQKMRQPFTGLTVLVSGEQAEEHPRVYTSLHLEFVVQGRQGVAAGAVERAIELSETRYCPAISMLSPAVEITTSFRIEEV